MNIKEIRAGTLGGTLCSIWASVNFGEILHTVLMAAVGTLVSYAISRILQRKQRHKQ